MNDIDKITLQKRLIDVAEKFRAEKRKVEAMAVSDDKTIALHKDYWLEMAARYGAQADKVDELRRTI